MLNDTVKSFMTKKIISLEANAPLKKAICIMAEKSMSCIIIVDIDYKPIGIITERDISKFAARELDINLMKTEDVMTSPVETVKNNMSAEKVANYLYKHKFRRVVVINDAGILEGLITQTDEIIKQNKELLAEVRKRKQIEKILKRKNQIQSVLAEMLNISLGSYDLEEIFDRILEKIVSIPWLTLKSKGVIFLVEDNPNVLVMKSWLNISEIIQNKCTRVDFGRCLCGRVASTKELLFWDSIDVQHENLYDGISPHGHYCVPILFSGKTLGVLNLYVKEGHKRSKEEEGFLQAITNVLAGIIERKRTEMELTKHHLHLEDLVKKRTREIEELNANLESRVKEELEKSRQKDLMMIHQSRLAAMGEMLGHIAHQWKQPLNALNILLYNILDSVDDRKTDKKVVHNLISKGESIIVKMATTVDDFNSFFKPNWF
jgi:CBS domain-containing protein/putative methionine-R-sulfoxide reductase with GAF domain